MACLADIPYDLAKDLVIGAVKQLRYACCFNRFVQELEDERNNLITTRDSVRDRVKQAKKQTKVSAEVIDKWLEDANIDIDKVDKLLEKARTKKSCLPYCPNWFCRYYLGRKIANKKGDIEKCIGEGKPYIQFECIATLPSDIMLDFPSSENYLKFESRQLAYKDVMEAVKDEEVGMIGLYGMGGCGKTTLATQVGKMAEEEKLFEKVLFVSVSSAVDVRRIQEKIASSLSYEFPENEERERAKRLCMRLTQENKILLILDDVWEKLNLRAIGIPSAEDHKGCKVLITTRSENVCERMDCQRKIQLQILTDDEAWTLYQKQAGISESGTSDTLKDLARQISNECKGLPVAIAAVASTLKGKAETEWKAALDRLKSSIAVNIEKDLQDPYKCLQLSYDNLDSKEAKSLLLFCSVFPEDVEIPVEHLTRFAIGLDIVGNVRTYEGARNEVSAAKNKLVSCCLLSDVDNGKKVKMHDLVRDVVQWITKNENKVIHTLSEEDVTLEHGSIRYLWCEVLLPNPNELDCSNVEFLYITTHLEVPEEIFKGMGKLRVLVFFNHYGRGSLSRVSFASLTNLRYLFLHGWKLSDISFLGDLKKLEGLSLFFCSFQELPNDAVTQLTKLRLLELYDCDMERNNLEVIRKLPQLEELYINDNDSEWMNYNGKTVEFFSKFSVPQAFQRYTINLGTKLKEDEYDIYSTDEKILCLGCFHTSNMTIKGLAEKANALHLANIQGGLKKFLPDIFKIEAGGAMSHLIELILRNSDEIEYLVDSSNYLGEIGTLFSKLVELRIKRMENLRALWHGHVPPGGHFQKLENLYLKDCPELTSLFTPSLLQFESNNESEYLSEITPMPPTPTGNLNSGSFTLSSLTSLRLESCLKLGSLFTISTAKTLTSLEELKIKDCRSLNHILEGGKNQKEKIAQDNHDFQSDISMFPSLKTLDIDTCNSLRYVLPISFAGGLKKLENINIDETPNLKYFFGESIFENHSCSQQQKSVQVELPALKELTIMDTTNMISICPDNFTLVGTTKISNLDPQGLNVPIMRNVREITLRGIDKVKYIFTLSNASLMMLEILTIWSCPVLKHVIDIGNNCEGKNWDDAFPNLKQYDCEQLEYIFSQFPLHHHNNKEINVHFPALEELSLTDLPNFISILPTNSCLLTWPSLNKFFMYGCPQFLKDSISDLVVSADSTKPISETNKDIVGTHKHFLPLRTIHIHDSKLETIFRDYEHQTIGQEVCSNLEELELESLPKMTHICVVSKYPFSFQNLHTLRIKGCEKLEVIFPASVLRCLPELKCLEIGECEELKHVIEEEVENNRKSNLVSSQLQPCFPKLEILIIDQCHKLKRFISASTSNDLPNLKILFIIGSPELEELIGSEQRKDYDTGDTKVELQYLKISMFSNLSRLRQRIESQTVGHRLVHNCPNLSLTSTYYYLQEFKNIFLRGDLGISDHLRWKLQRLANQVDESFITSDSRVENSTKEDGIDSQSQMASSSELPSSQKWDTMSENIPQIQMNNGDPTTSGSGLSSEHANQPIMDNLARTIDEHNQIESGAAGSKSYEFLESKSQSEGKEMQLLEEKLSSVSSPTLTENLVDKESISEPDFQDKQFIAEETISIEEIEKESIQEMPTLEKDRMRTLSADVEGLGLGGIIANHDEFNGGEILAQDSQVVEQVDNPNEEGSYLSDKEGGIGAISNDSNKAHQALSRSQSLVITKLEECKHFMDLDDAEITLLTEAISVYPQLWNVCEKFSERFQAWMLKTLADMLFFLRNESVTSVTPKRLKEFHRLCDEAAQLGFERSWVDEMRQRVMDRDPEVDSAQSLLGELLQRHDQLTQELVEIKGEINSLNDFVAARKKCFDFL